MKNPLLQKWARRRVFRGGGWNFVARRARVSFHDWNGASYRMDTVGFRLFRTQEKS